MKTPLVLLCLCLCNSCFVSKEQKKHYKIDQQKQSEVMLSAYLDTPFSGLFITLLKDSTCSWYSSGMLRTYEIGNWSRNGNIFTLTADTSLTHSVDIKQYSLDTNSHVLSPVENGASSLKLKVLFYHE